MTDFPRLVVFDVDGTLVDSQHNIVAAMAAAWAAHGLGAAPAPHRVRRVIGLPLAEAIRVLMGPGAAIGEAEIVSEHYKKAFQELRRDQAFDEPLFPDARAALDTLDAAGYLLGVATGKSRRGLASMIERHGLEGKFVTLQTNDDCMGKPHPEMLLRAMAETGARPADTVMIGDTSFDMNMAQNAKTQAIGVAWGYHDSRELAGSGAQEIIESFSELVPALERLGFASGRLTHA